MKPVAYMGHFDIDNPREAGVIVTRDEVGLHHQSRGKPDRIDALFTADQVHQVEQQRDELAAACQWYSDNPDSPISALEHIRAALAKVKP